MDVEDHELATDDETVMLPPPRTVVTTVTSFAREQEVRPAVCWRIVELFVLAALAVIGFAVGLSCVAAICAVAIDRGSDPLAKAARLSSS